MSASASIATSTLILPGGKKVNSDATLSGIVGNAWTMQDIASAMGSGHVVDVEAIVRRLPGDIKRGIVVGLRPSGTYASPMWRASVKATGLAYSDHEVGGDEVRARGLSGIEAVARAVEYAAGSEFSTVVVVGIDDCLELLAAFCRRHRKVLVVADHPSRAHHAADGVAAHFVELDDECFPSLDFFLPAEMATP